MPFFPIGLYFILGLTNRFRPTSKINILLLSIIILLFLKSAFEGQFKYFFFCQPISSNTRERVPKRSKESFIARQGPYSPLKSFFTVQVTNDLGLKSAYIPFTVSNSKRASERC